MTGKEAYIYQYNMEYLKNIIKLITEPDNNVAIYDAHQIDKQKIFIVYLEDWLRLITNSEYKFVILHDDIDDLKAKVRHTELFVDLTTSHKIDLSDIIHYSIEYTELIELYQIFVKELEYIQSKCLEKFTNKYNQSPVIFVPFSKCLNRLSDNEVTVFKFKENIDEYRKYSKEVFVLNDKIQRIETTLTPKVKLAILNELMLVKKNGKYVSNLPTQWLYVKEEFLSYQTRMDFIGDIYNIYRVNKMKCENEIYIGYPFLLEYIGNNIEYEIGKCVETEDNILL